MHNLYDTLAKRIGHDALSASGATIVQFEIVRDAQFADLRHDPHPDKDRERDKLGLLGRIAAVLCLIDVFAHPLGSAELKKCLRKHLAHVDAHEAEVRSRNRDRQNQGLPPMPTVEPLLWILAVSVSGPLLRALGAQQAEGWPSGVTIVGGGVLGVHVVAANQLPRERSTLLVRLMVAGPRLSEAIADLAALPDDAHERIVAENILLYLRERLGKKQHRSPEEEEFIVNMQDTWEGARKLGRVEGRAEGLVEGQLEALLSILDARGLAVSDEVRALAGACRDAGQLKRWIGRALTAASAEEVVAIP